MSLFKKQQGVAMIELGIAIFLLVSIVFGITEFGRAIYEYNNLAKAARDAARYLSTKAPGDAVGINTATCLAVYGKPFTGDPTCGGGTSTPLAAGLTTAMINICDAVCCPATHLSQGAAPAINLVTVTIGGAPTPYPFNSLIPFVVPDFDFGPISVTMKQPSGVAGGAVCP